MNPKIYEILKMINQPISGDARVIVITRLEQISSLLVLLSEEAESQSTKISNQTDKLIKLTKAIVCFTIVLFFIGAIQIILMICKS